MKYPAFSLILIYMLLTGVPRSVPVYASDSAPVPAHSQIRVTTALDHLTVLEFDDAVTQVAVGSSAFQVERQGNKIFVKPLKAGAATNLLVWTASKQSFDYELTVGEVSSMNSQLHSTMPKPAADDHAVKMDQIADQVITLSLLGRQPINNGDIVTPRNKVGLRIEGLFLREQTTYIQYSVENLTSRSYRLGTPSVYQLHAPKASINLLPLRGTQLARKYTKELGNVTEIALPIVHADAQSEDVPPGESKQGVIAVRNVAGSSPLLWRIVLDPKDPNTEATLVF
jgi:hypothetical protein